MGKIGIKIAVICLFCLTAVCLVSATDYVDPVCNMSGKIDANTSFASFNHTIYYFCSPMCKEEFEKNPEKFLDIDKNTTAVDPVCKMNVDIATANVTTTFEGTTYYFCKTMCKDQFEADPLKYIGTIDPVCGMNVDADTSVSSDYNGSTYYFCSEACKQAFDADPDKYLK
ncbi:MAG: YHS domain-containing protein [Methanospirillum sp.]|uniref:YHS domain-containing protein n=1 Tax=Methanospirillum sp. TaxID=45200 RepID=UPI00236BFDF3|nr:YHS domain-containing protein [Methanospirillum sp.]MDD1728802.1 YHS domain-containing protein [Methanospirillum sp.]